MMAQPRSAGVGRFPSLLAPARFCFRGGAADAPRLFEWRGTALGAEACIAPYHRDEAAAGAAVGAAVSEVERLEGEFSLYRPDSALVKLNRDGVLDRPSLDMLRLLQASIRFGEMSGGAFDVTVQPLWELYARHFAAHPDDAAGPRRRCCARLPARRFPADRARA
ncbi:MAG: FAD:protein FMN transferase [Rhodospirillales bacterium]